ncbi:MAG: AzlC family ABC transporter permease [Ruminococcaceae bacterium]|nr:AzlC family ABC transporter permease [Oscillospiraceae bacterium]
MSKRKQYIKGFLNGLPIGVGYLSVSFAFGIFAIANGLTSMEAVLISMSNLTSAGQLAAVPIIAGGGAFVEIIISQLIINLRYALMSISLSQKLHKSVKLFERFLIAFGNTDEIFAVAISNPSDVTSFYMYGLITTPFLGWSLGTLLGAVAGNILPKIITSALGVAIYGMFVAIVVPVIKREKNTALCVASAIVLSCAFKYIKPLSNIPSGFVVIICAVVASMVFALIAPIKTETEVQYNA